MLTDFEAYLLSRMRAKKLVAKILVNHGLSPADLMLRARRAIQTWGLDRPGYDAGVYSDAIGRPIDERVLSRNETALVFAGSVRRLYRLRLWPRVSFCVNQHPSGYAWGEGFVQSPRVLRDPTEVKPWEWVYDIIESAASHVEIIESWAYERDVRLSFGESDGAKIYLAKFDYNLLQEWDE